MITAGAQFGYTAPHERDLELGPEVRAAFCRAGRRDYFRGRHGECVFGRLEPTAAIRFSCYNRHAAHHFLNLEEVKMNAMVVTALIFAVPMLIILAIGLYLGE